MAKREHSVTAWRIASLYSGVLASETRDLAAHIDVAIKAERERCAVLIEQTEVYGATPEHPGVSHTSPSWRKQIAAAIRALA